MIAIQEVDSVYIDIMHLLTHSSVSLSLSLWPETLPCPQSVCIFRDLRYEPGFDFLSSFHLCVCSQSVFVLLPLLLFSTFMTCLSNRVLVTFRSLLPSFQLFQNFFGSLPVTLNHFYVCLSLSLSRYCSPFPFSWTASFLLLHIAWISVLFFSPSLTKETARAAREEEDSLTLLFSQRLDSSWDRFQECWHQGVMRSTFLRTSQWKGKEREEFYYKRNSLRKRKRERERKGMTQVS